MISDCWRHMKVLSRYMTTSTTSVVRRTTATSSSRKRWSTLRSPLCTLHSRWRVRWARARPEAQPPPALTRRLSPRASSLASLLHTLAHPRADVPMQLLLSLLFAPMHSTSSRLRLERKASRSRRAGLPWSSLTVLRCLRPAPAASVLHFANRRIGRSELDFTCRGSVGRC